MIKLWSQYDANVVLTSYDCRRVSLLYYIHSAQGVVGALFGRYRDDVPHNIVLNDVCFNVLLAILLPSWLNLDNYSINKIAEKSNVWRSDFFSMNLRSIWNAIYVVKNILLHAALFYVIGFLTSWYHIVYDQDVFPIIKIILPTMLQKIGNFYFLIYILWFLE